MGQSAWQAIRGGHSLSCRYVRRRSVAPELTSQSLRARPHHLPSGPAVQYPRVHTVRDGRWASRRTATASPSPKPSPGWSATGCWSPEAPASWAATFVPFSWGAGTTCGAALPAHRTLGGRVAWRRRGLFSLEWRSRAATSPGTAHAGTRPPSSSRNALQLNSVAALHPGLRTCQPAHT